MNAPPARRCCSMRCWSLIEGWGDDTPSAQRVSETGEISIPKLRRPSCDRQSMPVRLRALRAPDRPDRRAKVPRFSFRPQRARSLRQSDVKIDSSLGQSIAARIAACAKCRHAPQVLQRPPHNSRLRRVRRLAFPSTAVRTGSWLRHGEDRRSTIQNSASHSVARAQLRGADPRLVHRPG